MASYSIGGILLTWLDGQFPLVEDSIMTRFRFSRELYNGLEHIIYEPIMKPLSELSAAAPIYANDCTEAYNTPDGVFIVCHWGTCRYAYGVFLKELLDGDKVRCYIDPAMLSLRPLDTITLFSTAGLHSQLLQRGAAVLHSSFIEKDGEAILFAGSSGMGKSTQASLWEKYGSARIINGDRTLLRQTNGRWFAYGYPCCGSSGICLNECYPVKAIVLLEQGSESRILHPSAGKKLSNLMAGIEVYTWDPKEVECSFGIAKSLVHQLPVVMLSATADEAAVEVLDRYLNKC